jgi:hypothetical protein
VYTWANVMRSEWGGRMRGMEALRSISEGVETEDLADYQLKEKMTLMSASDLFASYKPEYWYDGRGSA